MGDSPEERATGGWVGRLRPGRESREGDRCARKGEDRGESGRSRLSGSLSIPTGGPPSPFQSTSDRVELSL